MGEPRGHLDVGTIVDCLFGKEFFRGRVHDDGGGPSSRLFRVVFDDGDVREDVPPEDMELPLEPGCRVECLFEGEDDFFDGTIARDNGDATYRVDFDDGDVLDAAPRHDIRAKPREDDRSAESFEGNEENSLDDIENERGHNRLHSKTSQQQQQQHGEASQEQTSTIVTDDDAGGEDAGLIHAGQRLRSGKQGYLARAPRQSSNYDEGNGETDGNERGGTEKEGGSPAALETRRAGTEQTERATSDRAGSKQGTVSAGSPPSSSSPLTLLFLPTAANPLHAHLEALAVAAPRLLAEAPPDFRLSAVSYRIAALEEQLRQQEERGEAWNLPVLSAGSALNAGGGVARGRRQPENHPERPISERAAKEDGGSPRATTARGGAATPSFPAHKELRKVVENLSALRMRQVALVRLCHGEASLEMVQAVADLAEGYAKEGLWSQVSNHMARAANILVREHGAQLADSSGGGGGGRFAGVTAARAWQPDGDAKTSPSSLIPRIMGNGIVGVGACGRGGGSRKIVRGLEFPTDDRYTDPAFCRLLSPGHCARLLLELFGGLRRAAALADDQSGGGGRGYGQVLREDLEAFLSTHEDKVLRSIASGLIAGARMPSSFGWGAAVGCLRQHSSCFADLNLKKVMEGVRPKQAAKVHRAFQTVDPENTGSADAEVLALMVAEGEDQPAADASREPTRQRQRRLLGIRVKLLTGRCQTRRNNLPAACRNLSEALAELERLGLGESSGSVPVLNAMTDALALTHRRNLENSSRKAKKLAETWIQGKEGQDVWKQECKRLLLECRRKLEVVPRAEIEERTWQALVAYRSKTLTREIGGEGKELDAAENNLVRAWEILESCHGRINPDVGAACISLGNLAVIRRKQGEAIDWFRRALGTFE
ncbi:unnamed protein product, partial [Pylaiella littoralis]